MKVPLRFVVSLLFLLLRGKLVDFYDRGDHVHIWGLKFRKDEHIWGLRF